MVNSLSPVFVSWLAFISLTFCEDIQLPQGNNISINLFQQLQSAHGVAVNQKNQENLFLSLPLVAPNQTDSVAVGNISDTVAAPQKFRHRNVETKILESRQTECNVPIVYEGQDPCQGLEQHPDFVECDKPCKFTRDWFVANMANPPQPNQCLFYTSGLSERANAFASEHNARSLNKLTTIWKIWDRSLFAWNKNIDNPMRCIIQDNPYKDRRNQVRQGYFERMSDSMAYVCGGNVAVMDRNIRRGRTGKVKQGGIWQRQEFPRLKMAGSGAWMDPNGNRRIANRIDAIGENLPTVPDTQIWWRSWWYRNGPDWPNEFTKPFRRRDGGDGVHTNETVTSDHPLFQKRDSIVDFDTSIFDEGGRLSIDW